MMLTANVCLMLSCFLVEKFYLHYAVCDFGSLLLHCTKLFICQSIDRKKSFDVTFENPPIEKSCVRHWWKLSLNLLEKQLIRNSDLCFVFTTTTLPKTLIIGKPTLASRVPLFLLGDFPTNECEISDFCL